MKVRDLARIICIAINFQFMLDAENIWLYIFLKDLIPSSDGLFFHIGIHKSDIKLMSRTNVQKLNILPITRLSSMSFQFFSLQFFSFVILSKHFIIIGVVLKYHNEVLYVGSVSFFIRFTIYHLVWSSLYIWADRFEKYFVFV